MNGRTIKCIVVLWTVLSCGMSHVTAESRRQTSLDLDWRFHLGDAEGSQVTNFDDSSWRQLNVPHDWSIEGPFSQDNVKNC